jgi:hypothetical protein
MKTRHRMVCEGWWFNRRHYLVLQVWEDGDGPPDCYGLPAWIDGRWRDAYATDLAVIGAKK